MYVHAMNTGRQLLGSQANPDAAFHLFEICVRDHTPFRIPQQSFGFAY